MSSIRRFPDVRVRDSRGFTLVELLVALMISGLLVTVIYQLLSGNSRFVQLQSAREEVQQNARAALDIIAGDLRAIPPGGVLTMGEDSVRAYVPRAWGVLCDTIDTTSPTAWVLFPAGVLPTLDIFGRPHWGVAVEQTADPAVQTATYRFVAAPTQQVAGQPCATIQPNLDPAQHVWLGFNRPAGTSFVTAGTILPGTQVLVFEEMKYDVAESGSSGVPGYWIRRMIGRVGESANMQPMAGPVPETGALRFTYLRADGVTPAATADEVAVIRVQVIVQSRSETGSGVTRAPEQMDTVSTDVYLRNTG